MQPLRLCRPFTPAGLSPALFIGQSKTESLSQKEGNSFASYILPLCFGNLAQLVERHLEAVGVRGSIPRVAIRAMQSALIKKDSAKRQS